MSRVPLGFEGRAFTANTSVSPPPPPPPRPLEHKFSQERSISLTDNSTLLSPSRLPDLYFRKSVEIASRLKISEMISFQLICYESDMFKTT